MAVRRLGRHAPARRALQKALLDQVGLDHVLDGARLLADAGGEEAGTIEDVIEPYLIQQGYLQRTPRGRVATQAAYRHLGLAPPQGAGGLF